MGAPSKEDLAIHPVSRACEAPVEIDLDVRKVEKPSVQGKSRLEDGFLRDEQKSASQDAVMISAKFVRRGDDLSQSVGQIYVRFDVDADRQPVRLERHGGNDNVVCMGQRADYAGRPNRRALPILRNRAGRDAELSKKRPRYNSRRPAQTANFCDRIREGSQLVRTKRQIVIGLDEMMADENVTLGGMGRQRL